MADPLMDEATIAAIISPDNATTADDIRTGAWLCVMSCVDRKVSREFTADVLTKAMRLFTLCARIEAASTTAKVLHSLDPERMPERLDKTVGEIVSEIRSCRQYLLEKIILVSQCPTSEDRVS